MNGSSKEGYVLVMRHFTHLIPIVLITAGCAHLESSEERLPETLPVMRQTANSISGNGTTKPTVRVPGGSESKPFVGFVGDFTSREYFEVVGRADCDDWVYLQPVSTGLLMSRPEYYASGNYTGNSATAKCLGIARKKLSQQKTVDANKVDAIIFDPATAVITDTTGWFNNNRKIFMEGWAVRYVEPSEATVRKRITTGSVSAIDALQRKAAAAWIERHPATDLQEELRQSLPLGNTKDALSGWRPADIELFTALAVVEDSAQSDQPYRNVLGAGIARMLADSPRFTVAAESVGNAADVAANVIACRAQPGSRELLRDVLMKATITQHKLAAARGLIAIGDRQFVEESLRDGALGDVASKVQSYLAGRDGQKYVCPYRRLASALDN